MAEAVRIANCSGFYGDRLSAAREMVEGGPIDVLTGDWLAELTMLILARTQAKRPGGGYARSFVQQMEQVMGTCLDRGIKVVANAGGLDPDGCAEAVAAVAGHIIECGTQATGGNYSYFTEVPGMRRTGFPWADVTADGSCVIGKHDGTGGEVSIGTVTSQLLYEIDSPAYLGPDVTARFDTVELEQAASDRVRVSGVRGEPPPATLKVAM